jgi:hypothetical protein
MLYLRELGHDGINEKLGLQELFLIDGAIEEALELQVPEEVPLELSRKEMVLEVLREVTQDLLEGIGVLSPDITNASVEQDEISMIGV